MSRDRFTFIDLFAGCGGLSLGLLNAGWQGVFAIEKNFNASKTLMHNLVEKSNHNKKKNILKWPDWLDKAPYKVETLVEKYQEHLMEMRGKINLVAGGPPCQGFSFAGKRAEEDPRNELFMDMLTVVTLLQPELVLIENVLGINSAFKNRARNKNHQLEVPKKSYAFRIKQNLEKMGYEVQQHAIKAVEFGVPQQRLRFFSLGIRKDILQEKQSLNLYDVLMELRPSFLKQRGLPSKQYVTTAEAISDLRTKDKTLVDCVDPESPSGFKEIVYTKPETAYQKLMHGDLNGQAPNSLRLVNHRPNTIKRFKEILRTCKAGAHLSNEERARLGINKSIIARLAHDKPSYTITTIPDDLLHYEEPRVHTVRENARLQSFPDWFEFKGGFTTGGDRRAKDCPRYTQVGNAVPPLLAEIIGEALMRILRDIQ